MEILTNTSYSASVGILFQTNNSPYFGLTLLNNGDGSPDCYYPLVYGYKALLYDDGALWIPLARINSDGSATVLSDNYNSQLSLGVANLNHGGHYRVCRRERYETNLTVVWAGVDGSGNPAGYSCSYDDTSAQRYTSGTGLAMIGYPSYPCDPIWSGNGVDGVVIDNLVVADSIAAAPIFIPGGEISPLP